MVEPKAGDFVTQKGAYGTRSGICRSSTPLASQRRAQVDVSTPAARGAQSGPAVGGVPRHVPESVEDSDADPRTVNPGQLVSDVPAALTSRWRSIAQSKCRRRRSDARQARGGRPPLRPPEPGPSRPLVRFWDVCDGPLADEGERAFRWQRPDPEVVMPAPATTASPTSDREHRPFRRLIRLSWQWERHPLLKVRRFPSIGELDSEPHELRIESLPGPA